MPASVSIGYALWMDGETVNGLLGRQTDGALGFLNQLNSAQVIGGVLPSGGGLFVSAGGGMSVSIGSGYAIIPSSSGSTNGGYKCASMSAQNLTVAGSDLTNPRIDLACATVSDVGTSSSFWELQVVTGVAAPSPSAPSLPSNSIALAQILVPAGSSSVTNGNITDERTFTAAQGGIVPVRNLGSALSALTGYNGNYVHDRTTSRLAQLNASGALVQLIAQPFTPQSASVTAIRQAITGGVVITTVSVTTDGNTDLEIIAKWPGLYINASAAYGTYGASMLVAVDASTVAAQYAGAATNATAFGNNSSGLGGGTLHHLTTSGIDRPSAASHTITFQMNVAGDGTHQVQMTNAAGQPATLYVRAAPL